MWRFVILLVEQHLPSFGCSNSGGLLCPHSAKRVHPAVMPDHVCINCYNFSRNDANHSGKAKRVGKTRLLASTL